LHWAQSLAPLRIPDFEMGVFNQISYQNFCGHTDEQEA
jgi:hypothetical protein